MKIKICFAGARWLGIECLKILSLRTDVKLVAITVPRKTEKVWWTDVVDENEVKKLGFKITDWSKWPELKADLGFSVLHGKIFRQKHIQIFKYGLINLHPAPLPEYRGCNSYAHAIMNGDKTYRVTMHYIDEGIDTGDVIADRSLQIGLDDTGRDLYLKAQMSARDLFKSLLDRIIQVAKNGNKVYAKRQDESNARYYPRDSLEDKEIKLSWPVKKIYYKVRGLEFPPFEPAFVRLGDKKIYLATKPWQKND